MPEEMQGNTSYSYSSNRVEDKQKKLHEELVNMKKFNGLYNTKEELSGSVCKTISLCT